MGELEKYESFLKVPSCNTSDSLQQSKYRGTYFAVILYEDDPSHVKFLNYVLNRPQYDVAYIKHLGENDPDDEDADPYKDHIHCLVHVRKSITVGSFVKFFDPWIKFAVCIKDYISYLSYMLHDTPRSEDKLYHYSLNDLQGDSSMWKPLLQKSNFVQFGEFFNYFNPGMTVTEVLDLIRNDQGEAAYQSFVDFVTSNSFLIIGLTNQDNNMYFRRQEREAKESGCYY